MHKLLIAAALAPASLMLTAAAPAGAPAQDVLDTLTDKTAELFEEKGLSPNGFVNNGQLAQGAQKRVSVTLTGGSLIVGICDGDCGDLNLHLTSDGGKEVDKDVEDDDFPIVVAIDGGSYTVTVTMKKCGSSGCRYRLLGFSK